MSTQTRSTLSPFRDGWKVREEDDMPVRVPLDKIRVSKDRGRVVGDSEWMVDAVWIDGGTLYISEAVDYYRTQADAIAHIPDFLADNGYTIKTGANA